MKKRMAFTLVELTVSISAGSAMMILSIGLLHQSMTLASVARGRSDHGRTLNRLAQDFRRDVHRASKSTVNSPQNIELTMPDDTVITYTAIGNRVTRREQQGEDSPEHRETFEFLENATASFERLDEPIRSVLTVVGKAPSRDPARVDLQVAAVVGRLTMHERAEMRP